jgi:site-specific recombinase XerD
LLATHERTTSMPLDCANALPTDCVTEIWVSALQPQGRSPGTIASYRHAVGRLRRWANTEDLTTITRLQAVSFVRLLQEGHKPGCVAIVVRFLRAGWSWMLAEGLVTENVFARMRITVPEEIHATATDEEIERMLRSAARSSRRDHALLTDSLCSCAAAS